MGVGEVETVESNELLWVGVANWFDRFEETIKLVELDNSDCRDGDSGEEGVVCEGIGMFDWSDKTTDDCDNKGVVNCDNKGVVSVGMELDNDGVDGRVVDCDNRGVVCVWRREGDCDCKVDCNNDTGIIWEIVSVKNKNTVMKLILLL